jgi:hypothetical protein
MFDKIKNMDVLPRSSLSSDLVIIRLMDTQKPATPENAPNKIFFIHIYYILM